MPELTITIGGRDFEVACHEGEEQFLQAAAATLDTEAQVLVEQAGRLPEPRMLLMAGLMLADKTAGLEKRVRALEEQIAQTPPPPPEPDSTPVPESPALPDAMADALEEIVARAEELAQALHPSTDD